MRLRYSISCMLGSLIIHWLMKVFRSIDRGTDLKIRLELANPSQLEIRLRKSTAPTCLILFEIPVLTRSTQE